MAETARRKDEPDRETLREAVVEVHRTAHKMLYAQALERRLLMSDITLIELELRRFRGAGGRVKGDGLGPEGAD